MKRKRSWFISFASFCSLKIGKGLGVSLLIRLYFRHDIYDENKDNLTNLSENDRQVVLEVGEGTGEVQFPLSALEDLLHEKEEMLTISLLEVGARLIAGWGPGRTFCNGKKQ